MTTAAECDCRTNPNWYAGEAEWVVQCAHKDDRCMAIVYCDYGFLDFGPHWHIEGDDVHSGKPRYFDLDEAKAEFWRLYEEQL